MSTAYRQSSERRDELDKVDPDNRLLGRMSTRRLEAEIDPRCDSFHQRTDHRGLYGPAVPVMPDEVGQIVIGVDTRDTAGRPTGQVVPLGPRGFAAAFTCRCAARCRWDCCKSSTNR